MLKSLKSNSYRFVVVLLLLLTFLTTGMVGKVIPSYALAQPVSPELAPVFDTQIYQFQEYCQEHLSESQYNILYLLLGAWVCSQAGMNEYELVDPYTTDDGVRGWLKSTGITIYNQMLNLAGGRIYDPVTGTDLTPLLSSLAGYALGAAAKASTYESESDFINDVETSEHYFVPYDPVLQASINAYFGRKGGLWDWQFDAKPFETTIPWKSMDLGGNALSYNAYLETFQNKIKGDDYRYRDSTYFFNMYFDIPDKYDLFINTTTSKAYFVDSNGNKHDNVNVSFLAYYYVSPAYQSIIFKQSIPLYFNYVDFSSYTYSTIVELVNKLINPSTYMALEDLLCGNADGWSVPGTTNYSPRFPFFGQIINHVYEGLDWGHRQEVFNLTDLNFAHNDSPSYNQVPDDTLLDIKGLLVDILDNTDLFQIVVDNLFKPDGTLNIDLPDIKVSINLPDTNPLPVNLNDIQIYTDNEYLDVVKQRALQASETIGEYVAFWHNCDSELVYAILGSFIVILIGAFIGKWGHS